MDASLVRRRALRQNATDAEKLLWRLLRARRFFGLKFRRQHPVGPYIVDFFCPASRIAIELDGGQHFQPHGQAYDERRTRYLRARGVRVLRFSNNDVFCEIDGVIEAIRRAFETQREPARASHQNALSAVTGEGSGRWRRGRRHKSFLCPRSFRTKLAVEVASMSSPADRRSEARYAVAVAVTLESEHNFYTGLTSDLSGGGLFVATNHLRPIGERIHLRMTLPTSRDPIDAVTEVRWVRTSAVAGGGGEPGMGLQFLQLTPHAKEAIKAFLKKRDSLFYDVD